MSSDVIADAEQLYRRVHPTQVKDDGKLSSAAFTDPELSVDRAMLTTTEQTLREHPKHGIAAFTAGLARELEQEVVPDASLFNRAHALVKGSKPKSVKRRFAREAELIRQPASDC